MNYSERVAIVAPDALLRDAGFWRRCRPLLATLLGGIAFMLLLHPLTRPQAKDPTAWLTIFIQLLVVWGAAVAIRSLARLEVDDAIALLVEQRVTAELARIKGGWKDRISLDRLSSFLPSNPSRDRGILRLFRHIIEEAKDRKFHANALVIEPFREDGLDDLLRIQTVQKIALQLGILGTFAGLIIALRDLAKQGRDLLAPSALNELFAALHISFSTSIAGLEVAMILALVVLIVRRRQEIQFKNVESASAAMIALARNSINEDDFLVEFEQMRTVLTGVGERIRDQAREVEVQTNAIRDGLRRLVEVKDNFDVFLGHIREEQGEVLREMRSVYDIISPRNVAEELRQSLSESQRQVAQSFRDDLRVCMAEFGVVTEGLRLAREVGEQTKDEQQGQLKLAEARFELFRQMIMNLANAVEKNSHLQAELLGKLAEGNLRLAAEPSRVTPLAATSVPQFDNVERSLEKVARQLESLSREINRNNSALNHLVSAHSFYRSMIGRPREWWSSMLRAFSRLRPGGAS